METPLREAVRRHAGITVLGALWAILLFSQTRELFWWLMPVLTGLVLSIPLSVWSSKMSVGQWAKGHGLFLIPEEVRPPLVLRRLHQEIRRGATRPWGSSQDGLAWVLNDPDVRSVHLSLLAPPSQPKDPLAQHRLEGLRLKVRSFGQTALSSKEKRELLCDADSIRALCRKSEVLSGSS
jgi:membrane glycosyltransferase